MNNPLKIGISLPIFFNVRDFLFTPVWDEMKSNKDAIFYLFSSNNNVLDYIQEQNCPNIIGINLAAASPFQPSHQSRFENKIINPAISKWQHIFNKLDNQYLYDTLMLRFVAVNNLSHYDIRKSRSPEEKKRHQLFHNYKKGEEAGFPFPKSKILFKLFYKLRHGKLNIPQQLYVNYVKELKLDLFVFGRLHFPATAPWARIMKAAGVPMLGMVGSWDHPTVQGPTPRGMSGYIVASRRMLLEMSDLHGISREKISQIGKVQMDVFKDQTKILPREKFLNQLGVPVNHRLITFATNTTGLNEHEISIAEKLAQTFNAGTFGNATLLLRTHPQDLSWETTFLPLANSKNVICTNAFSFGITDKDPLSSGNKDQIFLANLMQHSDIVIQSRGSIALDAIAFDTPVISLGYDGDLDRLPQDSYIHEYSYEHYKPIIAARGTWFVGSHTTLENAISAYLKDPSIHLEGRNRIRQDHIEPLDGNASQRLVNYLVTSAQKARSGILPDGDWHNSGLGDTLWAAKQTFDPFEYLDREQE